MEYAYGEEIIGDSLFTLDGQGPKEIDTVSEIISNYTNISLVKVKNCIMNKGLQAIFDNPSLVGANDEQKILILKLKDLVDWGFDNAYESI